MKLDLGLLLHTKKLIKMDHEHKYKMSNYKTFRTKGKNLQNTKPGQMSLVLTPKDDS